MTEVMAVMQEMLLAVTPFVIVAFSIGLGITLMVSLVEMVRARW